MRTPEGRVVGEHIGLAFYTIGQRKGIGIGGMKETAAPGGPWYVAQKDMARNELIVVQGRDHPLLHACSLVADDLAWVAGEPPQPEREYGAKTRYRQADARCHIAAAGRDALSVAFDAPQRAVTPGQSVVVYQDDVCLGGGVIQ
jgi:tRNA-specific 2-thiouridylase